jgi:cobalt-zinc-cadmium efflux system outer membrane protein
MVDSTGQRIREVRMTHRWLLLLVCTASLSGTPARSAAADSASTLSLPEEPAARQALEQSPGLQLAHESIAMGVARESKHRAGTHEWELYALAQQRTDPAGVQYDEQEYGIQRAVRWPWKYSMDRDIGARTREVGELSYLDAWHEASRELLDLWFEWLDAERTSALLVGQAALLRQQQDVVGRRVASGDAAQLELQLAAADSSRLRAASAEAARRAALARESLLRAFPGLPTATPARLDTPVELPDDDATWTSRIVAQNHEIVLADTQAEAARLTADRAGRDRLADPSIGLRYSENLDGNHKVVGLQFVMPIGGSARAAEAAIARSEARMAATAARGTQLSVEATARTVISDARLRYRTWYELESTHRQIQENAVAATRGYELGEFEIATMLSARRQALESQLALETAQLQALRAYARVLLDAHQLWAPVHHDREHDAQ